jgi:hypothetical protein
MSKKTDKKKSPSDTGKTVYKRCMVSIPEETRELAYIIEKKHRRKFSNLIDFLIREYARENGIKTISYKQ